MTNRNSLDSYWMPFTANRDFKQAPRLMESAEGVYYRTIQGEPVIDAVSGLFCSPAGHGRAEIADAVAAQVRHLDFAMSFQSGHPLPFKVADRLAALTPGDLNKIFFTNSGSESVDTALKIALAYHVARGDGQRTRFISRERAYHGVNFGGMSVGGIAPNLKAFGAKVPGVLHMRHTWLEENRFTRGQAERGSSLANDLQRFVDLYGAQSIAACIVEPIAGSIGVYVPPKGYLERLRTICDIHGILLIFDEVICGFGRTGKAFGAQSFDVMPDMILMAKALTNATIPMGAVAVSDKVYDTITGAAPDGAIELFHGYTYSGHPVACAAALATLDIYEKEGLFERAGRMSPAFLDAVFALQDLEIVTDIRGYGMLAAFDLAMEDAPGKRGMTALKALFANGLHTKATGDTLFIAPPLVATEDHIAIMLDRIRKTLSSL